VSAWIGGPHRPQLLASAQIENRQIKKLH